MLIVRETFTAKPGQATKLAKLLRKVFGTNPAVRIMTDLVGNYNTVVMEMQAENLQEFEKELETYKSGKPHPKMDPKAAEEMSTYTEMWVTGRREIFQVMD
jgi:hypothetical protein